MRHVAVADHAGEAVRVEGASSDPGSSTKYARKWGKRFLFYNSLDHLLQHNLLAPGALLALSVVALLAVGLIVDGVVPPGGDLVADAASVSLLLVVHLADGLVLVGEVLSAEGRPTDVALHALGVEHLVVGHNGVTLDGLLAHSAGLRGLLQGE